MVLLWPHIVESLEDPRAASVLTSIDYAMAFNCLDFSHCLGALADNGASSEVIGVIVSVLTSITMAVNVGQVLLKSRIVLGGVSQGSILGVYLFNATMDAFEAVFRDVVDYKMIGRSENQARVPDHDRSLDVLVEKPYNRPGFKAWEDILLEIPKYVDDNVIH